MKYLSAYLLLLSSALFSSGCSDNNGSAGTDAYPLRVSSVSLSGVQTRGTTALATDGTTISVSTLSSGVVSATSQYTYTGGAWGVASGSSGLVAPDGTALCAYYPYSAGITDKTAIPLSSVTYDASKDLCYGYATAVADAAHGTSHATFALLHAYSRLTFSFSSAGSYTGSKSIGNIIISNPGILRNASLNITQSTGVYSSKVANDVTFNAGITDFTANSSTSVLMVPTDALSGDLSILIQVGSAYKSLTLPSTLFANSKLEAGVNYQISVNVNGTLTLNSTDVQTIDWSVPSSVTNPLGPPSAQPESNSYIVAPGSTIFIPVSRATAGNAANFPSGASFTTGLLWSDVSATHVTATTASRLIKVTAGSAEGNSVVYAKNSNGDIVWSWHIWVTGYLPNTTTVNYNGKVWMDRNLGAKTNGTSSTAYGLYYQWGRKDPFPIAINGTTMPTTYGSSLATFSSSSTPVSLVTAIQNPNIFYRSTTAPSDWLTPQSSTLWNNSGKTIYDPCPAGWRVPLNTEFSGVFPDNTLNGYCNTDGTFGTAGSWGYWWAGVTSSTNAFHSISNYSSGNVNDIRRGVGISVRCIKN